MSRVVQQTALMVILLYFSIESLFKKRSMRNLRRVEEGLDNLGIANLLPQEVVIGFIAGIELVGVFAPLAIYFKKYFVLLLVYLCLTTWPTLLFGAEGHELGIDKYKEMNEYQTSQDPLFIRKLLQLCLFMIVFTESKRSISSYNSISNVKKYDPKMLKNLAATLEAYTYQTCPETVPLRHHKWQQDE